MCSATSPNPPPGKKWKSLTPSERAPCVQEAEKLRLKHMQVSGLMQGHTGAQGRCKPVS